MRVMDGVVRSGAGPVARPVSVASAAAMPLPTIPAMRPAAPRLDGLVRQAMATPVPAVVSVPQPETIMPGGRRLRPAIAFSLLLPALLISAGAYTVNRSHLAAPADRPVSTSTPVADAKPVSASTSGQVASGPVSDQTARMQNLLNSFVAAGSGEQYGILVKDLTTGATASSGADTVMNSASLYKLYVAQRVLAGIDTGKYTFAQTVSNGRTIDQCLNLMITISDNGCGVALGDLIGWDKQNSDLAALGFNHTNLKTLQQTSASDVAAFFERLYKGTLLSPSSTDYLMNLLKNQKVNNRLPQGLPAGTVFAHKTGDLWDVVHDAGIVYGPKGPYLVVVMSGKWSNVNSAPARFAQLSQELYEQQSQ